MALSHRTIVTCKWGVSDPRRARRGAKKGAAKCGSLTPWSLCSAATAAPTATPAAQSAAGSGARICRLVRTWTVRIFRRRSNDARDRPARRFLNSGNGAPEFRFPAPVPPRMHPERATRGGIEGSAKASEVRSRCAYRARRIVPRGAADLDRTGPLSLRTTAAGSLTGTNRSDGYM